jgi:hypothetical protein
MNIKELAKQMFEFNDNEVAKVDMIDICRFADCVDAQAVAREREACAKIALKYEPTERQPYVTYAADEIRARGEK